MAYTYSQPYNLGVSNAGLSVQVTDDAATPTVLATFAVPASGTGAVALTVSDTAATTLYFVRQSDSKRLATVVFDPREIASLQAPAQDSNKRVLLQPAQPGVTIPTVTTLTNAPTVPSAADTATAVWAASGRTLTDKAGFAPTAAQSATAVRSELGVELGRIDASITSRSSHSALDVWNVSQNASFMPNTMGAKLKLWLLDTLGRGLLSRTENVLSDAERDQVRLDLARKTDLPAAPDNAKIGQIWKDYARRTGDYSTLQLADVQPSITVQAPDVTVQMPAGYTQALATLQTAVAGVPEQVAALQVLADIAASIENLPTLDEMNAGLAVQAEAADPSDWPAAKARIFALGASSITVQNPVLAGGKVELIKGGDYRAADGRDLRFTITGPMIVALAPSIATVRLVIHSVATLQVLGGVTATSDGISLSFELSAEMVRAVPFTSTSYYIEATTRDGHDLPLANGSVIIRPGGE